MPNHFLRLYFSERKEVMEDAGGDFGEVKVDLVEGEGGSVGEGGAEEKVEVGEATDTMDTEQKDVKLQIEDDPETGREEETKEGEKDDKEVEIKDDKEVGIKEESEGDEEKVGNLDDNYQGLVEQLRLEFGKGQHVSHVIGINLQVCQLHILSSNNQMYIIDL